MMKLRFMRNRINKCVRGLQMDSNSHFSLRAHILILSKKSLL